MSESEQAAVGAVVTGEVDTEDGYEEWRNLITAEIGMLLMGRDLRAGGSFVTACHEIANALKPWVLPMAVRAAQRDRLVARDREVLDEVQQRASRQANHRSTRMGPKVWSVTIAELVGILDALRDEYDPPTPPAPEDRAGEVAGRG